MHIATDFFPLCNIPLFNTAENSCRCHISLPICNLGYVYFCPEGMSKHIRCGELVALLSDCCKRSSCSRERKNECPQHKSGQCWRYFSL